MPDLVVVLMLAGLVGGIGPVVQQDQGTGSDLVP
jgi:hypothetical protein